MLATSYKPPLTSSPAPAGAVVSLQMRNGSARLLVARSYGGHAWELAASAQRVRPRSLLPRLTPACDGAGRCSVHVPEAGEAGGAQAAFVRFWVAGRSDSRSVLAFGAKWIISGRQRVRCGRRACITNACLWHNLRLVHRFEDYRGTRIT